LFAHAFQYISYSDRLLVRLCTSSSITQG
jgi:hypothetical protein